MDLKSVFKSPIVMLAKMMVFLTKTEQASSIFIKILDFFFLKFNSSSMSIVTLNVRPSKASSVFSDMLPFIKESHHDVAIVVQGPILNNGVFLLETLQLYKILFPEVLVIVSTWVIGNTDLREEIDGLCCLLENDKPRFPGGQNINYQIVSTLAGVMESKRREKKYCLKTRTDQRLYSKQTLDFLKTLLKHYPIDVEVSKKGVKGRVVELGISVCKYRPWSMCDMFQFGSADDLHNMWDVELDDRSFSQSEYREKKFKVKDIVNDNVAEIYIHREYAKTIGLDSSVSTRSYYDAIRKAFIIIDKEMIDIYWNKYSSIETGWSGYEKYSFNNLSSRLTFVEWLMLYDGKNLDYEKLDCYLDEYEN